MELGWLLDGLWCLALSSCFLLLQEDLTLFLYAIILGNSIILAGIGSPTLFVEFLEPDGKVLGSSDDLLELV
jgi:hypothetical protein